jgi:hypothetical protein
MSDPKDPIVADTEACTAAADAFITTLTSGVVNPQQRYRNVAHAMNVLQGRVRDLRAKTRAICYVATKKSEAVAAEAELARLNEGEEV